MAQAESLYETEGPAAAGPTPLETDAAAWEAITKASQQRVCPATRELKIFLESIRACRTGKNDDSTNIIDQDAGVTYNLNPDQLQSLLKHLEACRRAGMPLHFSERQGSKADPRCGLMLDYDMTISSGDPRLTDRHYYRIAGSLAAALQRDIDLKSAVPPGAAAELKLHIFFIVKRKAKPLKDGKYKYGLHVLVPGIKLSRDYKKWLLRQFAADSGVNSALRELGVVGEPEECLDQNSASVPVLFFGSCKRSSNEPYELGAALELTLDLGCEGVWQPPPVVRKLDGKELDKHNLVAELSLTTEAAEKPLVCKTNFEPRLEILGKVRDWGERTAGNVVPAEELMFTEHSLSTLTLHDAEALQLHALLDLLTPDYYTDRNKWRNVIFALANTNVNFKPLAVWFSQKCPAKWADGGSESLDKLWDDAVARRAADPKTARPLTSKSISYWARNCDPKRYEQVMERSYFTTLTDFVFASGGKLTHYPIAKVLLMMLGTKFCVDVEPGGRGGSGRYSWFEFVLPGQPQEQGEVWKWRHEAEPDDVHIFMSEVLPRVFDSVSAIIEDLRVKAKTEDAAKYYKDVGKAFKTSKLSLHNTSFKRGVIEQAGYLFRRRGFVKKLDTLPNLFGTLNGVLKLGATSEFINYYHEYPISKFSPVDFTRFDPCNPNPWQKLVLGAIADIIIEPDVREWIMFHAAQGLSGELKEGLLLLWEGGGQNGKTSFLRWVAKSLGPYAEKFNIQLLSSEREDADKPNSAMMRFKQLNWAYCEESNQAQKLNVARMKEIINAGEISSRDLNSKQETFSVKTNVVVASQYPLLIDTKDHGTWRRIRHYTAKAQFRQNPDPNNPMEKKEDQKFVRVYPDDPQFQAAFLSILVHYYERLQREFNGELKNVASPTLEKESEAFRISQDSLHRWISQTIVLSPDNVTEYPLGVLASYYIEWYRTNIDSRERPVAVLIIKDIESSALGKHLRHGANRALVLRGCRMLTAEDMTLRPGEKFITAAEQTRKTAQTPDTVGRKDWWMPRHVYEAADDDADEDVLPINDDLEVTRAGRPAAEPAPTPTPAVMPQFSDVLDMIAIESCPDENDLYG